MGVFVAKGWGGGGRREGGGGRREGGGGRGEGGGGRGEVKHVNQE